MVAVCFPIGMSRSYSLARPVGSAFVGLAAMLGTVAAFDPPWFVRWGVMIAATYAAYGLLYWISARKNAL